MLLAWSLSTSALLLSIYALSVARRTSDQSLAKRLSELSLQSREHAELIDQLSDKLKNLRSRVSMQAHLAKKANGEAQAANGPMTEAEKDEWQREMNLKIATGQVKTFGR